MKNGPHGIGLPCFHIARMDEIACCSGIYVCANKAVSGEHLLSLGEYPSKPWIGTLGTESSIDLTSRKHCTPVVTNCL